jgi:hypothetical protein
MTASTLMVTQSRVRICASQVEAEEKEREREREEGEEIHEEGIHCFISPIMSPLII